MLALFGEIEEELTSNWNQLPYNSWVFLKFRPKGTNREPRYGDLLFCRLLLKFLLPAENKGDGRFGSITRMSMKLPRWEVSGAIASVNYPNAECLKPFATHCSKENRLHRMQLYKKCRILRKVQGKQETKEDTKYINPSETG